MSTLVEKSKNVDYKSTISVLIKGHFSGGKQTPTKTRKKIEGNQFFIKKKRKEKKKKRPV